VVEGELVLGRFTIGERIGDGGHGTVHRAWDERLCRWVAVKAVVGDSAGRVLREAHAAARLNHPGIVTLYELGEHQGCAYLVSELVEGPNLRELARTAEITDREVADVGAELCAALTHAHAAGVVHRDLKPDNVLVRRARSNGRFTRDSGERALLADFGIASVEDAPALTATGQVVGTLAYMSPEQALGADVGPETDVYSLGLTLYELWAGVNPVLRATAAATAREIGEPVVSLGEYRPELPLPLVAAVDSCLLPEPDERPDLAHLREALMTLRGGLHPDRAVPEPTGGADPTTQPIDIPTRPFAVLLGAGAIALAGSLAGLPGLAIAAAALLAPAALALSRPLDWLLPAIAPLLGLLGAAPAFLAFAARQERNAVRIALAMLAWAWTGVVGAIIGSSLGVSTSSDAAGWAASGPIALDSVLGPLLTPTAISIGLIWVGGTVLLGLLLDATSAAGAAVGGLLWSAVIVASLGAAGADAVPTILLTPALVIAVAAAIWDRHGRPDLREWIGESSSASALPTLIRTRPTAPAPAPPMRPPLNPAAIPPADREMRATRAATKHVQAALHGAGSRAGLP
jgi:hypothetical protein